MAFQRNGKSFVKVSTDVIPNPMFPAEQQNVIIPRTAHSKKSSDSGGREFPMWTQRGKVPLPDTRIIQSTNPKSGIADMKSTTLNMMFASRTFTGGKNVHPPVNNAMGVTYPVSSYRADAPKQNNLVNTNDPSRAMKKSRFNTPSKTKQSF